MTTCAYCQEPATTTIIANPARVCAAHALEFWTGMLSYTHGRSGPCVRHDRVCECAMCGTQNASLARPAAVAS
jgi:hypothetical protein